MITYEPYCIIVSGLLPIITFTSNTDINQGYMECQRYDDVTYVVRGFREITTATVVNIVFFAQSSVYYSTATTPTVSVSILTLYLGSLYNIVTYVPLSTGSLSGYGMYSLSVRERIEVQSFSKDWERFGYEFNNRAADILDNIGSEIELNFPTIASGYDVETTGVNLYEKYLISSSPEFNL